MRKILFLFIVLSCGFLQAETPQGQIHILGDIDESTKQLFIQTITDELHGFTHHVSLQSESSLYVFPYQHEGVWQVVSFHVDGNHHQQAISQIQYADQPLSSLDAIREIIGLDGSLKYISWNSYRELPPEKIYLASKTIAQDYLFLHF
jgi:hypothetical protein